MLVNTKITFYVSTLPFGGELELNANRVPIVTFSCQMREAASRQEVTPTAANGVWTHPATAAATRQSRVWLCLKFGDGISVRQEPFRNSLGN